MVASKMKKLNRFISAFLALLMVISLLPANMITANASSSGLQSVSIRVTEADGTTAIEGANVTILTSDDSQAADPKSTDTVGEARFELDAGEGNTYRYTVEKTGYETASGDVDPVNGNVVTLNQKDTVTLAGTVTDAEGKGLPGASVKLTGYCEYEAILTDEDGNFSFSGVYAGENYTILVELSGYKTKSVTADLENGNEIVLEEKTGTEVTFEKTEMNIAFGTSGTNAATAANGAKVSYSSEDEAIATVDENGTVTPVGIGTTRIQAVSEETEENLSSTAEYALTVEKGTQAELTWVNSVPGNISWKEAFTNTVTGGSGDGEVTYASSDEEIATVGKTSGSVTFLKPGTVTITAAKAEDDHYEEASAAYTITAGKADQEALRFTLGEYPNAIFYGDSFTNTAAGGSLEKSIEYSSSDETVAKVNEDGSLDIIKAGEVTITAKIVGDEYYKDVTAEYKLTIYRADQKAEFLFEKGNASQTITYGEKYTNAASGGENSPISYSSSDETIATVDENGAVTAFKAGTVTITASNPEDDRYNKKEISYELTITRAEQTVVFENGTTDIPAITYGDSYQNQASAETKITYASSDEAVATVDEDGKITTLKSGTVTITATAEESDQYAAASGSYKLTINKAEQTITLENGTEPNVTFNENNNIFVNAASTDAIESGEKDISCVYSITSGENLIDNFNSLNGSFTVLGAGRITICVEFSSNDRYNGAESSYTLTVEPADQEIVFPQESYAKVTGEDFKEAPAGSETGEKYGTGAITYAVTSDENGIISSINADTGEVVLTYAAGSATITATKAADANYKETSASYTLNVEEWNPEEIYYKLSGDTVNESGWFIGNVSVTAPEGYEVSYTKTNGSAEWQQELTDAVTSDGDGNTISFYVKDQSNGYISGQYTETIRKDAVAPSAEIKAEGLNGWEKFLSIITFGAWEKDTVEFTVESSDETSGVDKVEYYIADNDANLLTKEALDTVESWTEYEQGIKLENDFIAVVYAKVTDAAGNYVYASTNGVVFDGTAPNIKDINFDGGLNDGVYYGDVRLNVSVEDAAPSSGIQKVEYWVTCNGKSTTGDESIVLYEFNHTDPTQEELQTAWSTDELTVMIDSQENNSDEVTVYVKVTDNAGNSATSEKELRISAIDPTIDVSYLNDPDYVEVYEDVTYYNESRTAEIVITGRTSLFEQYTPVIEVTATDYEGNKIEEAEGTYEISDWVTVEPTAEELESGKTKDDAIHTAQINFNGSANYTFSVSYTNKKTEEDAGFSVGYESDKFAVDKKEPTAEIRIAENKWTKLLETLTFGIWSKDRFEVSASAEDEISPTTIEYYISNGDVQLTEEDLEALSNEEWTAYKAFTVSSEQQFAVYLRVTDYAGNRIYLNSDGHILDQTNASIELTPDQTEITHNGIGVYKGDVGVQIEVEESGIYSGIQQVEYWVLCNGEETQREILYSYSYTRDTEEEEITVNGNGGSLTITEWYEEGVQTTEKSGVTPVKEELISSFRKTITVDAKKNNSCDVKVYVGVTDNAGNYSEQSLALDIDATAPTIQVTYDNNDAYKVVDERGYFGGERTATVVITERTAHFSAEDATELIQITAKDINEKAVISDCSPLISNWTTIEGETADVAVHTATITYSDDANYTFAISYTDKAGNQNTLVDPLDSVAPFFFTVDKKEPTAEIRIAENKWTKLLETLTFGFWSKDRFEVSASAEDETSPTTIEYYISNGDVQLTEADLEALSDKEWTAYEEFTVSSEQQFAVYLRVTDYAGNRIYLNSDGHILDRTESVIQFTPDKTNITHNNVGVYNKDVSVRIDVTEQEPYSGIQTVEYWVLCDGEETQREVLYSYSYTRDTEEEGITVNGNSGSLTITEWYEEGVQTTEKSGVTPVKEELISSFRKTITVDAEKNNSCDVKVYVGVTDNAGNYSEQSLALDIDVTAPTIQVTYDNDDAYKVVDGNGYFPAKRTATVVITERTAHFSAEDATELIQITAKDINGEAVISDCSSLISNWKTVEGKTAEDAVHTATITYSADANYTFAISYTDKAGNQNTSVETANSVTPYRFTVDKTAPTGTVTVGELGTWSKLVQTLTFGLWSRSTVKVSGTSADATSPIESVSYYKTADTSAKTVSELNKIWDWKSFNGFNVKANEQFTVYLRIVDSAGNTSFISTDGVIVDNTKPIVESIAPMITITPEQPVNGIYNTDVRVAVKVEDPKEGTTNAYSGLQEIRYEVYNLGELTQNGTLYSFANSAPTQSQLRQVWEKDAAIVVDKNLNNSNDVKIKVYAVDNAGNASEASETIQIDITNPTISVSYDNNDGDVTFADNTTGAYFKRNRTATITVTERNFDPEKVIVTITNTDGTVPVLSGWSQKQGAGNGDSTTHTATLTYSADGDYTFAISCTDMVGNANETVNYGNSLAPEKFTVDKTLPVVSVTYDNNNVQNGNYYKDTRTAKITVTEHNFESSRVKVSITATDDGRSVTVPVISNWSSRGDVHTATITYSADALYTFDFDYEDKAGNASADLAVQSFYVDKTNPVVTITNIVDESANNTTGNIGFVITATDTNFDVFTPVLTAVIKDGDRFVTKELEVGTITSTVNGKIYTVTNLDSDGIYRIRCTVVDKAGNAYSEVILTDADGSSYVERRTAADTLVTFSVNRDGSAFEIDQDTTELVEKYYIQYVTGDVVIVEINADPLKEYEVTLNGRILTEGTDYTVTLEGGNGEWAKYIYTIDKSLFEEEGEYKLVVSSKDEADNDAFSDVKNATVSFVVDRTAPIVAISGLAANGRYQTDKQRVTLIPTDDGGALRTLIVRLVDADGNVIKELINLEGDELAQALEEGDGKLTFEIEEGLYQNVQILCSDYAVNENGDTNTYNEIFTNVSVSSSAFMIFWANKPLRYGMMARILFVMAGIILIIILKKRKKKEEA